jgi:probable HAF family extracellular repeat protein
MKKADLFFFIICVVGYETASLAASFQGLGYVPGFSASSSASGVSADGSTVVGSAGNSVAFRWTSEDGMVVLKTVYSSAYGVSADGSIVVGDAYLPTREAFFWTSGGGMAGLGYLPGAIKSTAYGISADGSVVVGISSTSPMVNEATYWTSEGEIIGIGDLPGGDFGSIAYGVSADGLVIVGGGTSALGVEAFRWTSTTGMVSLGDLLGGRFESCAKAVSADGSVVVGYGYSSLGQEAFRWTSEGGLVGLGDLPGAAFKSNAMAISADGSVVVGTSTTTSNVNDLARYGEAFYWTESAGMQNLKDLLIQLGADLTSWDLTSTWTLTAATGISADGKTIVGYGYNGSTPAAWIATIPEPATFLFLSLGTAMMRSRKYQF